MMAVGHQDRGVEIRPFRQLEVDRDVPLVTREEARHRWFVTFCLDPEDVGTIQVVLSGRPAKTAVGRRKRGGVSPKSVAARRPKIWGHVTAPLDQEPADR